MIIIIAKQTNDNLEKIIEILANIKQELKNNDVAKEICQEYGFDVDIIDGIPMEFIDNLESSAKTIDSRIQLNTSLLDEDFEIIMRYAIHELVHSLQHMRSKFIGESSNDAHYLDRKDELEAFQYQVEYDAQERGIDEAEEYVEDLVEYHEIPDEEKEEKKQELLEKAAFKQVRWKKPSFFEENAELERTADENNLEYKKLKMAIQHGHLEFLSEEVWSRLENTESYTIQTLDDVREIASFYDRDVDRIIVGIESGQEIPAPIVITIGGNEILVSGNTRLMICRALNIRPKIWHGTY